MILASSYKHIYLQTPIRNEISLKDSPRYNETEAEKSVKRACVIKYNGKAERMLLIFTK